MKGAFGNEIAPELSVVVLCYRGGDGVKPFVERLVSCLNGHIENWEIILVGNYFPDVADSTPRIVSEIAASDLRIKAVVQEKKGMMGWDVRSGLEKAGGRILALIDGDGQMPEDDILRAYKVFCSEKCDIVKTYRAVRHDSRYRRIISKSYNTIFRLLFAGLSLRDINAKPKLIARDAYERLHLTSDDWFIDAEMMIQCRRLNLKILEIPTVFYALKNRRSFIRLPAILEFIKNLIFARIREFIR